jgi:hypothetical protein
VQAEPLVALAATVAGETTPGLFRMVSLGALAVRLDLPWLRFRSSTLVISAPIKSNAFIGLPARVCLASD